MKSKSYNVYYFTLIFFTFSLVSVCISANVNIPPTGDCILDLDIDSDNYRNHKDPDEDDHEEDIEMNSPGKIIMVNRDDDDVDQNPDHKDAFINGNSDRDNDMAVLVLKHTNYVGDATVVLEASRPELVRIFRRDTNELLIGPEPEGKARCTISMKYRLELVVEGVAAGQVKLTLRCTHGCQDDVLVTVVDAEFRIDSLNKHGTDVPPYDEEAERVKNKGGSLEFPGKIIYMNDMDVDGDTIPDFLDGWITVDGAPEKQTEKSYDKITNGKFVPLVLKTDMQGQNVQLKFDYAANDPTTFWTMSLVMAKYFADRASLENPFRGRIRVWKKDAYQKRNPRSVMEGGDFVPPDVPLDLSALGLSSGASQITLYVEGIGTSGSWGNDKIKVRGIIPASATSEALNPQDSVSYTVVRCVYKICAFRPYVCEKISIMETGIVGYDGLGNPIYGEVSVPYVTKRTVFVTNYETPSSMMRDFTEGMLSTKTDITYHGKACAMGHAYAQLETRTPDHPSGQKLKTGQTGMNNWFDWAVHGGCYGDVKNGTFYWTTFSGREDTSDHLDELDGYFESQYSENYMFYGNKTVNFIAMREFRVRPETARCLQNYRDAYYSNGLFQGYGLDATIGTGDPNFFQSNTPDWMSWLIPSSSRVGCGSYVGILTEASGLMTEGDVIYNWGVAGQMPIVVLNNLPSTLVEALLTYGADGFLMNARSEFLTQNPQWGQAPFRSLQFCDPGLMMEWIDERNNSTTVWETRGYKDKGVDVRYDKPDASPLTGWKRTL